MQKVLILSGPFGVGKTTVIKELQKIDDKFVYLTPFITRHLRKHETDKINISIEELQFMQNTGKFLVVNEINGVYYATPKYLLDGILLLEKYPIIDFPITKVKVFANYSTHVVYLLPPSLQELKTRLQTRGDENRIIHSTNEIQQYNEGRYDKLYNDVVIARTNEQTKIAKQIYKNYIDHFK